jgi:excisionase family DNA binding protein
MHTAPAENATSSLAFSTSRSRFSVDVRSNRPARPEAARRDVRSHEALIDLKEVAARLGVTERFVRRLVFERRIPHLKVGRLLRFAPSELDAWLDDTRRDVAG